MRVLTFLRGAVIWLVGWSSLQAAVVINELFYRPPEDIPGLQWIELYNPDSHPVDLTGWKLSGSLHFEFPAHSSIGPDGYLVLGENAKRFAEYYHVPVAGEFTKSLKHAAGTIELRSRAGAVVDRVRYTNREPWPVAADGYSASLERICPAADGTLSANWAASPMAADEEIPAGSPGARNHAYSAALPPTIEPLTVTPLYPGPGEPIQVQARVNDPGDLRAVELRYALVQSGAVTEETVVPMKAATPHDYSGTIPGQKDGTLLRFRVRAVNAQGAERSYPATTALRPALSLYVQSPPAVGAIPLAYAINTDPQEVAQAARYLRRAQSGTDNPFKNPKRFGVLRMLDAGLDLAVPWTELTINHAPDPKTFQALRKVFIHFAAERQQLIDTVTSNTDIDAAVRELPDQIRQFQGRFMAQVQEALPGEERESFGRWFKAHAEQGGNDPEMISKMLLKIEGGWLALNQRFELGATELEALRPIYREALAGRSVSNPALKDVEQGPAGFPQLQKVFGEVDERMWANQRQILTLPQARSLERWFREYGAFIRPRLTEVRPLAPRGRSAFIVVDPQTKRPEVYDFVNITERSAGYKVRFHKDHLFRGMNTADVIFETEDRFVMAEPLAYELYRRVGCPAPDYDFVRLSLDGQVIGYHLLFEQINRSFLRRQHRNPDGELYKLIWYGCSIEAQHDKQNHLENGHTDLLQLIDQLNRTQGDAQWAVIEKNFNVPEVLDYFAVNMCLSHWDGFFNNYFAYHDTKASGKWEMYPWDQDKTWGYYDMMKPGEIFFNMPITFGMEGDRPPGGGPPRLDPRTWWRPGGFFSKPLLANPEFRKRFLRRTKDILETQFTPGVMFPVFDAMAARLRPEMALRAAAIHEDPAVALKRLDENVASFKETLTKRREFLLNEPEIKALSSGFSSVNP